MIAEAESRLNNTRTACASLKAIVLERASQLRGRLPEATQKVVPKLQHRTELYEFESSQKIPGYDWCRYEDAAGNDRLNCRSNENRETTRRVQAIVNISAKRNQYT
jgi:hypothetical protein